MEKEASVVLKRIAYRDLIGYVVWGYVSNNGKTFIPIDEKYKNERFDRVSICGRFDRVWTYENFNSFFDPDFINGLASCPLKHYVEKKLTRAKFGIEFAQYVKVPFSVIKQTQDYINKARRINIANNKAREEIVAEINKGYENN